MKTFLTVAVMGSLFSAVSGYGQEMVPFKKGALEAVIPKGFTYTELTAENKTAHARGYFAAKEGTVRFYVEFADKPQMFFDPKNEAVTGTSLEKKKTANGTWFSNQFTIQPVDGETRYVRYVVFERETGTVGFAAQFGIEAKDKAEYEKWRETYLKFKKSVMVDAGH
jgi:hypothetical protein